MNSLEQNSQMLLKQLHLLSVDKLASLIDYHNENYFIKNEPQITDEAFDKLIETLRSKDPYHPSLMKIVGNSSQEIIHKYPMLSLDKCYDKESFLKWQKKIKSDYDVPENHFVKIHSVDDVNTIYVLVHQLRIR